MVADYVHDNAMLDVVEKDTPNLHKLQFLSQDLFLFGKHRLGRLAFIHIDSL